MTDYPTALAALREARDENASIGHEPVSWFLVDAALAALEAARGEAVDQQFRWRPLGQTEFSDWTSKHLVTDGWVSRARAAGHDVEVRDVFAAPAAPAAATQNPKEK